MVSTEKSADKNANEERSTGDVGPEKRKKSMPPAGTVQYTVSSITD